jgi:hypothetical protein
MCEPNHYDPLLQPYVNTDLHFFLSTSLLRASGIVLVIATSPQCLSPFPIVFALSRRPQMELPQNAAPSACSSLVFRGLTQHLSSPCAVCHLADIPASAPSFASTRTHHTPCCRCSPLTKGTAALLFGTPDRTSLSGGDPFPLLCHISCVAVPWVLGIGYIRQGYIRQGGCRM